MAMTAKSSPATAIISAVSPANSFTNDIFTLSPSIQPQPQAAIPEETEDSSLSTPDASSLASPTPTPTSRAFDPDDLLSPMTQMRPSLRRHASHESLISVSGMDIHTLQSRPSQLLYSSSPRFSTPGGAGSAGPELTPWTATAHGTLSRRPHDSSQLNRSLLYSTIANQKRGARKSDGPQPTSTGSGITKKVGGWVFGKWGATPAPPPAAAEPPRPASSNSQQTQSSLGTATGSIPESSTSKRKDKSPAERPQIKLRPSGVNQNGPIWGFFDIPEVQTNVQVSEYDADALGEALAEAEGLGGK
jgi:hypothetical protein